jgi:hypothetical protein
MDSERLATVSTENPTFTDVFVEPCAIAQDGLVLRFMLAGPPAKTIEAVRYEDDDGRSGLWRVRGALDADGSNTDVARAVLVQDSGEGTSLLIEGGTHGLVLTLEGATVRVPYLLLAENTETA